MYAELEARGVEAVGEALYFTILAIVLHTLTYFGINGFYHVAFQRGWWDDKLIRLVPWEWQPVRPAAPMMNGNNKERRNKGRQEKTTRAGQRLHKREHESVREIARQHRQTRWEVHATDREIEKSAKRNVIQEQRWTPAKKTS